MLYRLVLLPLQEVCLLAVAPRAALESQVAAPPAPTMYCQITQVERTVEGRDVSAMPEKTTSVRETLSNRCDIAEATQVANRDTERDADSMKGSPHCAVHKRRGEHCDGQREEGEAKEMGEVF